MNLKEEEEYLFLEIKYWKRGFLRTGIQILSGVGSLVAHGWLWTDVLEIVQGTEVCELMEGAGSFWLHWKERLV